MSPSATSPGAAPPQTVEDLRSLLVAIQRGEVDIRLGQKALDALGRVLELRSDPAIMSITSLAERLQVNPSTLTRLSRTLGYAGFGEFQNVLVRASFEQGNAFYSQQAKQALSQSGETVADRLMRLAQENQRNVGLFAEQVDPQGFEELAKAVVAAKRVRVHGVRQFHAFASFLTYGLSMIRSDVSMLDSPSLGEAEGLAALDPGDLVVLSSCSPYTARVLDLAKVAAALDLTVVAVTDRASSPLVSHADHAVFVPHDSSFISNSMVAFFTCAECLINACAALTGKQAADALARRDDVIGRLRVET